MEDYESDDLLRYESSAHQDYMKLCDEANDILLDREHKLLTVDQQEFTH
jgi:hypothetical protein